MSSDYRAAWLRAEQEIRDLEARCARLKVLEVDALRRRVAELEEKLEWVKHALPPSASDDLTEWLDKEQA